MNTRVLDGEIITTRFEDTRAYRGVRTRRVFAFILDYFIVPPCSPFRSPYWSPCSGF